MLHSMFEVISDVLQQHYGQLLSLLQNGLLDPESLDVKKWAMLYSTRRIVSFVVDRYRMLQNFLNHRTMTQL